MVESSGEQFTPPQPAATLYHHTRQRSSSPSDANSESATKKIKIDSKGPSWSLEIPKKRTLKTDEVEGASGAVVSAKTVEALWEKFRGGENGAWFVSRGLKGVRVLWDDPTFVIEKGGARERRIKPCDSFSKDLPKQSLLDGVLVCSDGVSDLKAIVACGNPIPWESLTFMVIDTPSLEHLPFDHRLQGLKNLLDKPAYSTLAVEPTACEAATASVSQTSSNNFSPKTTKKLPDFREGEIRSNPIESSLERGTNSSTALRSRHDSVSSVGGAHPSHSVLNATNGYILIPNKIPKSRQIPTTTKEYPVASTSSTSTASLPFKDQEVMMNTGARHSSVALLDQTLCQSISDVQNVVDAAAEAGHTRCAIHGLAFFSSSRTSDK
ncbi:hypothetical protein P7C70_g6645, partial [Phenoliferia sp. Uapishka_3]